MNERKVSEELRLVRMLIEKKIFYIAIIAAFVLYILTKAFVFAVLTGFLIVLLFVTETLVGISKSGVLNEIKEIAIAIAIAVTVWYGSGFLLHTSAPYDAVVSCSMLPNLERGDLIVLQGAPVNAPEVGISKADWGNVSSISVTWGNETDVINEPLGLYCANNSSSVCALLRTSPELVTESYGPINIHWGVCERVSGNVRIQIACAKTVQIGSQLLAPNMSNDIIVYEPLPGDPFASSGLIIHRVLVKIKVSDSYFYLTKGDNNQVLDMQVGNSPVSQERVHGKVIARVPYLGYVKLFLSGLFVQPQGCDSTLENS